MFFLYITLNIYIFLHLLEESWIQRRTSLKYSRVFLKQKAHHLFGHKYKSKGIIAQLRSVIGHHANYSFMSWQPIIDTELLAYIEQMQANIIELFIPHIAQLYQIFWPSLVQCQETSCCSYQGIYHVCDKKAPTN